MIFFENNEIKIRDIQASDVVNLLIWRLDREMNRFDPRPIPSNAKELIEECTDHCNRFEEEIFNEDINKRKYYYFIITDIADEPIGSVNFFSIDREKKQGEMGIGIGDKRYWGKGIGTLATEKVVDYIFKNMDIDRIHIETGENNKAAQRIVEKLGFKKCDEYLDEDFKFIVMEKRKSSVK